MNSNYDVIWPYLDYGLSDTKGLNGGGGHVGTWDRESGLLT
jgi:hypothetical protein